MTLDEMIRQEQENAQKNQEVVKVEESHKTEQHFGGSEDNNHAQQTVQTQAQSSGTTISTIASSSDEHVNREEFSLKTKSFTPTLVPEDFYTVKLVGIDKKEAKDFNTDEMVPNFVWKMEIISDSTGNQLDKTLTITKWCKAYSKGENSNNYKFYSAFMQKVPEDGYNILDCIGKYARAYITQKSWNDAKTGVKKQKSVIEKLLPLKK
jgi:hypothetical protein